MTEEQIQEANEYIDLLESAIDDINRFSVYNDDIFNAQVGRLEDLVKELRKQL